MSPSPTLVFFVLGVFQKPIAQATIFIPNCTSPQISTNFVAAPNTRGTLSILWHCLSIIILCTWNIQHLNIPSRRPYSDPSGNKHGWLRRLWWGIVDTATALRWMALTIIMPEYIMGNALSERLAAVSSLMSLRSQFGEEMEMVHAYVMNMGGYYLDFTELQFFGVEVSKINGSGSTGLSSTLVDYSGVHFSGHQVDNHPRIHQGSAKAPRKIGRIVLPLPRAPGARKTTRYRLLKRQLLRLVKIALRGLVNWFVKPKLTLRNFQRPPRPVLLVNFNLHKNPFAVNRDQVPSMLQGHLCRKQLPTAFLYFRD
jgi:hypothetical protein